VSGPVFPSSTGTIREASNVRNRAWKPFKERAGYEWVTFRTFRKTVATLLDAAGLTARQIADILGHAHPSMTQDVYMGRGAVSRDGATHWTRAWERGASRNPGDQEVSHTMNDIEAPRLDHSDDDLPAKWSAEDLAELISAGDLGKDSQALRVLAVRIANRVERCEDPLLVLQDLAAALRSIAVTVQTIGRVDARGDEERVLEADRREGRLSTVPVS
jgi:transposase